MTNFLLLFIAMLLSVEMIIQYIPFAKIFAPIIALVLSLVITGIHALIRLICNSNKNETSHADRLTYNTNETEEERRARVNKELEDLLKR